MRKSDEELRDWYAGLAMQALISTHDWDAVTGEDIASDAFYMADEMILQRSDVIIKDDK